MSLAVKNLKLPCFAQALKICMNVLKIFSTIILLSDSECTYGALYIHSTIIFISFAYCLLGKDVIQYYPIEIKNMILNYTLHSVMVIVLRLVLNKKS